MSGRLTALRVLLGAAQVLMGVLLLLPAASIVGGASLRALASLPGLVALVVLPLAAPPVWVLSMGVRSFWPLTPRAIQALRWTHGIAIGGSVLLGVAGVLMLQAAGRSAERGGGLLGAFGLLPLALGILVGGLALASLCLLRAVTRAPST
jgi:ABC-type sulfate transport system permease component